MTSRILHFDLIEFPCAFHPFLLRGGCLVCGYVCLFHHHFWLRGCLVYGFVCVCLCFQSPSTCQLLQEEFFSSWVWNTYLNLDLLFMLLNRALLINDDLDKWWWHFSSLSPLFLELPSCTSVSFTIKYLVFQNSLAVTLFFWNKPGQTPTQ